MLGQVFLSVKQIKLNKALKCVFNLAVSLFLTIKVTLFPIIFLVIFSSYSLKYNLDYSAPFHEMTVYQIMCHVIVISFYLQQYTDSSFQTKNKPVMSLAWSITNLTTGEKKTFGSTTTNFTSSLTISPLISKLTYT